MAACRPCSESYGSRVAVFNPAEADEGRVGQHRQANRHVNGVRLSFACSLSLAMRPIPLRQRCYRSIIKPYSRVSLGCNRECLLKWRARRTAFPLVSPKPSAKAGVISRREIVSRDAGLVSPKGCSVSAKDGSVGSVSGESRGLARRAVWSVACC